jgi:WD40 repeat protein
MDKFQRPKYPHNRVYHGFCLLMILTLIGGCQGSKSPTTNRESTLAKSSTSEINPTSIVTARAIPQTSSFHITKVSSPGKGMISKIVQTPDKKRDLYIQNETLHVVDAATLKEVGMVLDAGLYITQVSPDSRYAAVQNIIGQRLVDLHEMRVEGRVEGSLVKFSNDSRMAIYRGNEQSSGGYYQYLLVQDISTGQEIISSYGMEISGWSVGMTIPAISTGDRLVAAGFSTNLESLLMIWDLQTGALLNRISSRLPLSHLTFSPNGLHLASGDRGGTVRIWDARTGQELKAYGGFIDEITSIEYLSNTQMKVQSSDQFPQVLNLMDGSIQSILPKTGVASPIAPLEEKLFSEGLYVNNLNFISPGKMEFSPNGRLLAIGEDRVSLWDVETGEPYQLYNPFSNQTVLNLSFSPDSKFLAILGSDGELVVLELSSGMERYRGNTIKNLPDYVSIKNLSDRNHPLIFSPDGKRIYIGSGQRLQVIDLSTASAFSSEQLSRRDVIITDLGISVEGDRIYSVINQHVDLYSNRTIGVEIWDTKTIEPVEEIVLPELGPYAYQFVAITGSFFVGRYEKQGDSIQVLWDLKKQTYQELLQVQDFLLSGITGNVMVSLGEYLHARRITDGKYLGRSDTAIEGYGEAISMDGTRMATFDYDTGRTSIWDLSEVSRRARQEDAAGDIPPVIAYIPGQEIDDTDTTPIISLGEDTPSSVPSYQPTLSISTANAALINVTGHFSPGAINSLRWEADGSRVVIAGTHSLASLDTRGVYNQLLERNASFTSTATRPDGHLLASGVLDGSAFVYDVTLDTVLNSFPGGKNPALSPQGEYLVYATRFEEMITYDLAGGQTLASLREIQPWVYRTNGHPIFSPDGSLVACVQDSNLVRIWITRSGAIYNALGGPDTEITELSFSTDGRYLVGASASSAWVWEVKPGGKTYEIALFEGTEKDTIKYYLDSVTAVSLSPDDNILALATSQHDIRVYNLTTRELLRTMKGLSAPVTHLAFDPRNRYLLSSDQDGSLILWNSNNGATVTVTSTFTGPINGLVMRQDGSVSTWGENSAWVIDPRTISLKQTISSVDGKILTASPDGKYLVVYEPYRTYLIDADTGDLLSTLEGEAEDVFVDWRDVDQAIRKFYGASFSQDSQLLATCGTGGVWIHTIGDGFQLKQHYEGIVTHKVLLSPDARYLAFSPYEGHGFRIYDLTINDPKEYLSIEYSENAALNKTGSRMAFSINYAVEGIKVYIVNADSGDLMKEFPLETDTFLTVLTFSPDDTLIAVGQEDGSIILLDASTGEILNTLTGHTGSITSLGFTRDGLYLVSGSADGTVGFWGAANP